MNAAHVHLLVNHFPVIGLIIGLLALIVGLVRKNQEYLRMSLYIFILAAVLSIPTYLSGEPAEEVVEHLPGVSDSVLEEHEDSALYSLIIIEILGVVSLAGVLLYRKTKPFSQWFTNVSLILAIVATGFLAWTSNLGGQIHHSEIRTDAVQSVSPEQMNDQDEHEDED